MEPSPKCSPLNRVWSVPANLTQQQCVPCKAGYYSDSTGHDSCKKCSSSCHFGLVRLQKCNRTQPQICGRKCEKGKYKGPHDSYCVPCCYCKENSEKYTDERIPKCLLDFNNHPDDKVCAVRKNGGNPHCPPKVDDTQFPTTPRSMIKTATNREFIPAVVVVIAVCLCCIASIQYRIWKRRRRQDQEGQANNEAFVDAFNNRFLMFHGLSQMLDCVETEIRIKIAAWVGLSRTSIDSVERHPKPSSHMFKAMSEQFPTFPLKRLVVFFQVLGRNDLIKIICEAAH